MDGTLLTYHRLIDEVLRMYRRKQYREAVAYLNRNAHKVGGNLAQIYRFLFTLTARAGQPNLALAIFQEAVEEGYWYSGEYLSVDDELETIRKYDDFERLATICREREEEARRAAAPQLWLSAPSGSGPLVVVLHGNQDSNALSLPHWQSAMSMGATLALLQSSAEQFSGAFTWSDLERGSKELEEQLAALGERLEGKPRRIVLGGFSAGCAVILQAIADRRVSADRLLLIAPGLPNLDTIAPGLDALNGTSVQIVTGELDDVHRPCAERLAAQLRQRGAECSLRLVEGLGHDYPDDLEDDIKAVLKD